MMNPKTIIRQHLVKYGTNQQAEATSHFAAVHRMLKIIKDINAYCSCISAKCYTQNYHVIKIATLSLEISSGIAN